MYTNVVAKDSRLWFSACLLPLLLLGWAEAYLDLCYCPGVDKELMHLVKPESKALRDRLHELRRNHTDSWDIYSPPGKFVHVRYFESMENFTLHSMFDSDAQSRGTTCRYTPKAGAI